MLVSLAPHISSTCITCRCSLALSPPLVEQGSDDVAELCSSWLAWLAATLCVADDGTRSGLFLTPFPKWSIILTISVIVLYAHIELTLVIMRWRFQRQLRRVAMIIAGLGLLGLY